jgi:hypothetical protein
MPVRSADVDPDLPDEDAFEIETARTPTVPTRLDAGESR